MKGIPRGGSLIGTLLYDYAVRMPSARIPCRCSINSVADPADSLRQRRTLRYRCASLRYECVICVPAHPDFFSAHCSETPKTWGGGGEYLSFFVLSWVWRGKPTGVGGLAMGAAFPTPSGCYRGLEGRYSLINRGGWTTQLRTSLLASQVKSLHKQQKTYYGKPIEGALEASSGEVRVDRTEKTRQIHVQSTYTRRRQ